MSTINYKAIPTLTADERLQIGAIAQFYYVDATQLLQRELAHCTHIYLYRAKGKVVAFFMLAWETLDVFGLERPALFLGLSCVDPVYRNQRIVSTLFAKSALDIASWQQQHEETLLIWFTTATPVIWHMMPRFFDVVQPDKNGGFTETLAPIGRAIQRRHYAHAKPHPHPFVLKRAAVATQYASSERTYLDRFLQTEAPTIFDKLGINEPAGDRILILCTLPDNDVLSQHRSQIEQIENYVD